MAQQVKNLRSGVRVERIPKAPTPDQLEYGEIAINYAADIETIFIKNSNDQVVGFSRIPKTVSSTGTSETDIMNQAAVTEAIEAVKAEADTKYLTSSAASETFLSKTDASNTYLSKTDAGSTYLSQSAASSTYLTKEDAADTYATSASVSGTYLPKTDVVNNLTTQDASKALAANQGYAIDQRLQAVEDELEGVNALADKLLVDSL